MADHVPLAHWYTRFDEFSYSTQTFYEALLAELSRRNMPKTTLSRVSHREGGTLSAYREYFQVVHGPHTFVLCAAPFGIDFFVSWWLLEAPGCLSGCVGSLFPWLSLLERKTTFYEEDTAIIFRDAVHQAVLTTIDTMFKGSGKELPEFDRKPVARTRLL